MPDISLPVTVLSGILIESTGNAEPLPMAATFDFRDEASESLGEGDTRTLVNLLTEQIEFADVVVLNKTTDAGPGRTDAARKIIKALNPDARLMETDRSRVAPDTIFDTGLFDFDRAQEHPFWAKELYGFAHHTPEAEEYGISSFVYRAREPFHPAKIHAVLNGDLPGVIRAKGHFWLASRPNRVAEFSLAGAVSSVTPLGGWWASAPRERCNDKTQPCRVIEAPDTQQSDARL
jgi:G3E family GTPase